MVKIIWGLFAAVFAMGGVSASSFAENWCKSVQAPQIHIKTSTDSVSYNFSLSEKALNGFSIDTVNPYGGNVITDVGGLMKGGIVVSQSMRYGTMTNTRTNEVCYWYTDIDISLHINPTIYIASEFPHGTCKHNAIMQHEQQHVMIDRQIVNKFAPLIGQAVKNEVRRQTTFGPISTSRQAELEAYLKSNMQTIVNRQTDIMNAERKQRQQALDNLQEYERVNHVCK
ncbi:MAG TPA: hypothetical protein PKI93_05340 [Alphaproteobacteria bacterium]|nr:hypothetical protein [Alphaproteobacteria bacterium]HNS43737.1 hypothetical protein [Alphaproteobacteria bacterium]